MPLKKDIKIDGEKFSIKAILTQARRIDEAKQTGILRMGEGRKSKANSKARPRNRGR